MASKLKKIKFLYLVLTVCLIVSCKKDYVCVCDSAAGYSSSTGSTTIHTSKKKAEEICNNTAKAAGAGTSCSIK